MYILTPCYIDGKCDDLFRLDKWALRLIPNEDFVKDESEWRKIKDEAKSRRKKYIELFKDVLEPEETERKRDEHFYGCRTAKLKIGFNHLSEIFSDDQIQWIIDNLEKEVRNKIAMAAYVDWYMGFLKNC